MAFPEYVVVRERARALLAQSGTPLTVAALADQIGTTSAQTSRALRELERRGTAVRERRRGRQDFQGGRAPDRWTAAG